MREQQHQQTPDRRSQPPSATQNYGQKPDRRPQPPSAPQHLRPQPPLSQQFIPNNRRSPINNRNHNFGDMLLDIEMETRNAILNGDAPPPTEGPVLVEMNQEISRNFRDAFLLPEATIRYDSNMRQAPMVEMEWRTPDQYWIVLEVFLVLERFQEESLNFKDSTDLDNSDRRGMKSSRQETVHMKMIWQGSMETNRRLGRGGTVPLTGVATAKIITIITMIRRLMAIARVMTIRTLIVVRSFNNIEDLTMTLTEVEVVLLDWYN